MTLVVKHDHNLDPVPDYDFQVLVNEGQTLRPFGKFSSLSFNELESLLTLERGILAHSIYFDENLLDKNINIKTDTAFIPSLDNRLTSLLEKTYTVKSIEASKPAQVCGKYVLVAKLVLKLEEITDVVQP